MERLIREWTCNYTPGETVEILQEAGVPAEPSVNIEELVKDPHLNERFLRDVRTSRGREDGSGGYALEFECQPACVRSSPAAGSG